MNELYKALKDEMTLEEAVAIREESRVKNENWEDCSEEDCLKYGKALVILEGAGKLKEVDENISSRLVEENGKWRLR